MNDSSRAKFIPNFIVKYTNMLTIKMCFYKYAYAMKIVFLIHFKI